MAVKVAILGTGSIGLRHYHCFSGLDGVEAVAVPARPERVRELRGDGVEAADAVPSDASGVVIATDTARHLADWAQFADRFCLVEKPLAGDPSPGLAELVRQTQGRAFTACVLRFHKTLSAFKDLIDAGPDRPQEVFIKCHSFLPDWRPGRDYRTLYSAQPGQGGALRELIHEIDYAGWIFGWPETVHGRVASTGKIEVADEDRAVFRTESQGVKARFNFSLSSKIGARRATAIYAGETVTADLIRQELAVEGRPDQNQRFNEELDGMYIRQAEAFVRAIQGGNPGPLATACEGQKALDVCQAVRLSSQTGQPVTL
ncbi:MAG: Gfo/Idh/MocA family oxidoreductase [Armatimonadetes bacterium]|nr:Gfo/Idh/MocA family oxidoreductase [Armatimonadota bacterium]